MTALCCWQCRKHEGPIELAWGQLQTAAAKDALCQDAMVHVYKLDASEASSIQKKYQFRTVPMYMHFFDGNLVAATNVFKGTDYFLQQVTHVALSLSPPGCSSSNPLCFNETNSE